MVLVVYWLLVDSVLAPTRLYKLQKPSLKYKSFVQNQAQAQGCAEALPRYYEAAQVLEAEGQRCRSRLSRRPVKDTDSATTLLGLGSHHLGAAGYHHWCWTSTSRWCRPLSLVLVLVVHHWCCAVHHLAVLHLGAELSDLAVQCRS